MRTLFEAPDVKNARILLNTIIEEFEDEAPKATDTLETGFEDAVAVLNLPEKYRRRLRTANGVER